MNRSPAFLIFALVAMLPTTPAPARAGFPGEIPDRFQLQLGGTISNIDTYAGLSTATGGAGAIVVFEDLFNLPISKHYLEAEGSWKFGGRHYVDAGYLDISRDANRQIDQNVQFGRFTFQAGAVVESSFRTRFVYAAYRYDLVQLEPIRLSASAGITATHLSASLEAAGGVVDENGQPVSGRASAEGKLDLPVPLFGLQMDWAVTKHSVLRSYTRLVGVDLKDIRGGMAQSAFQYHYYVLRNVAIGGGYERINVSLPRYRTDDYTFRSGYSVQGLSFFLRGAY